MATEYTVSVAGPERHDGESPYTYAVRADSLAQAIAWTLMVHAFYENVHDVIPILGSEHTYQGRPGVGVSYQWIDTTGVMPDGR